MPAATPYIAGLIGALLAALLTDWTLIVLSALAGAAAIVSVFVLQPQVEPQVSWRWPWLAYSCNGTCSHAAGVNEIVLTPSAEHG